MKRFNEIWKNTPALPRDATIIALCRVDPASLPLAVLIGQYKGLESGEEKQMLRNVLCKITSEYQINKLEGSDEYEYDFGYSKKEVQGAFR